MWRPSHNRLRDARVSPCAINGSALCRATARNPRSQRLRWVSSARPDAASLHISTSSTNSGGRPVRVSHTPSDMSSASAALASGASANIDQGIAMPVPVMAATPPIRTMPRWRTRFLTRKAKLEICAVGEAARSGLCRLHDWQARPDAIAARASPATPWPATVQSASITTTQSGGDAASAWRPKASA